MKLDDLKDKTILILGFGREGISTLQYLSKHLPNQTFAVADKLAKDNLSSEAKEALASKKVAKTYFGEGYLAAVTKYEVIIKSPGIEPNLPEIVTALENGAVITSATVMFFANCPSQIIGVTGTKGKSTTSSLIHEVLKTGGMDSRLVGNLGFPALNELNNASLDTIFVFELSSFQLYDLKVSPHIAVITNIHPEHLDWHESFENYYNTKANIARFQSERDYLIYNQNDPEVNKIAQLSKAKKIPFSNVDWSDEFIKSQDLPFVGKFNLDNVVAAIIIGREIFKIPNDKIKQVLLNFKPLPHRLEFVAEVNGIKFYNDSLATNPYPTIAAIESFGDELETLIAGGIDRGLDYSKLGKKIINSSIKTLILFPTTGEKIWQGVLAAGGGRLPKKVEATSMEQAVNAAFEKTAYGKVCLMSPAAASFNMFKDYADRGNQFKRLVLEVVDK